MTIMKVSLLHGLQTNNPLPTQTNNCHNCLSRLFSGTPSTALIGPSRGRLGSAEIPMICDGFEKYIPNCKVVGLFMGFLKHPTVGQVEFFYIRKLFLFLLRVSAKKHCEKSKSATQMPKAFRRVCATGSGTNLAASDE